jgi:hypothetical protein
LCEAGVDILDNKQPSLWMDSESVDRVRGRMTFSTCIDIQSTIHSIPMERIEGEVARLIGRLSSRRGGFVATQYDKADLMLPADKVRRMWDAFCAFRWGGTGQRSDAISDAQENRPT